jgi:hypothetical protein
MASSLLSLLSVAVSVIALLVSYWLYRRAKADTGTTHNSTSIAAIEARFAEHPELLRFHGISE